MSGHSKWSTIHRQKEVTDAKKGQAWTKVTSAIIFAVRETGIADPEKNFKLRLAIGKAKALNMPKENIQRAISRASGGEEGGRLEEVIYEGYGPGGIAVITEAMTDNKNRTTAEIKNLFERGRGRLSSPGAVSFQFEKTGLLTVKKNTNPDAQILAIMDLGVEDVEEASDAIEVYTKPEEMTKIKDRLIAAGFEVLGVEQALKPKTTLKVEDIQTAEKVLKFMESLEEHNDVQRVFANFDIPNEVLGQISAKSDV